MNIAGIILSAGESKRMGRPKALLEFRDGETLLSKQVRLLKGAGCSPIIVVVGSEADLIIGFHPRFDVSWCVNKDWRRGQFVSLQSGISHILNLNPPTPPFNKGGDKSLPPFEKGGLGGIFILPVDVAGVKPSTLEALLDEANKKPPADAVIPIYNNRGGHPIYLSNNLCKNILEIDASGDDARLDALLRNTRNAAHLPVSDKAVVENINTPDEWEKN